MCDQINIFHKKKKTFWDLLWSKKLSKLKSFILLKFINFALNMFLGTKNGLQNGLKLVLDVENFDYAYYPRGAKGFRVALTNALDQAVINQDGFYIAPGKGSFTWMLCCKTCHSAVQFYNQGKLSNKD